MKIDRNLSRRRFLETAGTATLAAMAAGPARQLLADAPIAKKTPATADTVIVLWMAGGMAHTEMFDPKRYTPFEKGLDPNESAQHVSVDRHGGRLDQVRRKVWSRWPR